MSHLSSNILNTLKLSHKSTSDTESVREEKRMNSLITPQKALTSTFSNMSDKNNKHFQQLPNGIKDIPKVEKVISSNERLNATRTKTVSYNSNPKRGESHDVYNNQSNQIRKNITSSTPTKGLDDDLTVRENNENNNNGNNYGSIIEKGLRRFYVANKDKFLDRVSKGPPESFRLISWIIAAEIPENRDSDLYYNYLNHTLNHDDDVQIKKDLNRTLSDVKNFGKEKNLESLYNVLKAFAISDNEVSYCQGMNFIAGYLLIISEFDEIETFYMMLSLFSNTYGD